MKQKLLLCLLMFFTLTSIAQQRTVTGVINDDKGVPLAGVSVTIKGTTTGTVTSSDGTFSLNVPANSNTLVISNIGFESREVDIRNQSNINITLTSADQILTDVVVVGYGTARRRDLTGAVASLASKDFNKGTFTSPDQLMQGKAAGVLVINNTGQPGGSTTVRIRGTSSIRSGNQPLFVIDGVPLSGGSARPGAQGGGAYGNDGGNPLNFINPNDIASMEILKDASATAIYGSRGANGVVLITTKRGQSGIPQIDAGASAGFSTVLKKLEVLSADEYRKALTDYNLGTAGDFGSSVDAWDAITQTALTQNYNVAVGGGNETGRYRLSAGYLNQEGVIRTSNLKKITANLTSNFRFLESKKLGLDFNVMVTQTDEQIAPISAFVGFDGNLISQALQWNPTHPLIKPGTDSVWIDSLVGKSTINPLAQLRYFDDNAKVNSIIASISPSFKFTDELEYRFLYSVNRQVGVRKGQVNRILNVQGIEGRGAGFIGNDEQTNSQITNTLSYNKEITSDFNLNALIGHEWLVFDRRGNGTGGRDFANVGLDYYNYLQSTTQNDRFMNSFASPTTELQSFFARAIMNFKDRYLVTATMRADGSTRFGENNKYGYFPSVGVAWNIAQEDFFGTSNAINNLKLRASWGKTGNQEFPSGASLSRFGLGQYPSISQSNFGNPDLKWETSATSNVGLDFGILNNRIFGSIDYFYKKTTDVLFEETIVQPAPSGRIWKNLEGYVLNKGLEIMLTGNVISSADINWNISANASFLENTVEGLAGFYQTGELRGQGFSDVRGQRLISGQPINVWYLRQFEGLNPSGQSNYLQSKQGGDSLIYAGSPNPKMLLGLSTDFAYKRFSATINMNGTFGHYLFNNTSASVLGIGNLIAKRNIAKSVLEGDIKEDVTNAPAPSTRNLEKGNYLKMANASIGYRVGDIGKSFKNVFISLTGQNLFVITNYSGFDPEVNTDGGFGGIPSLGIEYIPYPSARTVSLSVNFSL